MTAPDYVIIGTGAAGCLLTDRLSAAGASVTVLEAGPSDRGLEVKIPAAFAKMFRSARDWDFNTTPEPGLDGRSVYWPRGKMLGGSTSMNAQVFTPGDPADYDGWAESTGDPGWSFTSVAPLLDQIAESLGVGGLRYSNPLTEAFAAAAAEVGIPTSDLEAAQVTQSRGRRRSAADAYLRPALERIGVRVMTNALVLRIEIEGGRAVAVHYVRDGKPQVIRAAQEIILAAGAVGSPHLLQLSGIGPAEQLRRHGLDVVADLPAVGANLQDHLMAIVRADVRTPSSLLTAESVPNLVRWLVQGRGPLTSNVAEALAWVRTTADVREPDLELAFAPVHYAAEGLVEPTTHGVSIGCVALQPRSSGSIELASSDASAKPVIRADYLSDPEGADLAVLRRGVELARSVLAAPAMVAHGAVVVAPGPSDDIDDSIRRTAHTIYHPVGTCRMGQGPDTVVAPDLRVHGIERLRLVDASVMPRIPRAHTEAPTLVVAERAARLLLADPVRDRPSSAVMA